MQITVEMPDDEFEFLKSLIDENGKFVVRMLDRTEVENLAIMRSLEHKGCVNVSLVSMAEGGGKTFRVNMATAGLYLLKVAGVVK